MQTFRQRARGDASIKLATPAAEQFDLTLKQSYQSLEGTVAGGGSKGIRLAQSRLQGEDISFAFPAGGDRHRFKGRVSGDTMEGTVELAGGMGAAKWTATRIKA